MWDMAKKQKQQAGEWRNRIVRTGTAPASEFKANELNWRVHPKAQRDALKGVLSEVGWVTGVITNVTTGNVIDGHARIEEALKLGDETPVPFVEVELSEAEEMKILATLDPLSAMAGADKEQLDALLREVETADAAVMQMLDDLAKVNGLDYGKEGANDADAEPQMDKADELRKKWGVQRGQAWQLGEHRLMCGDSTSAGDVARLMKGEKADAVVTDPPYGQNQLGVPHDSPEELRGILSGCLAVMPITNAVVISFASPRTFPEWLDQTRAHGHKFERMLWLYKAAQMAKPWRGWILKSESILATSVGKPTWNEVKPYAHDCYYKSEVSGQLPKDSGWHGSIKPLDVVKDLTQRICETGAIVYDPFSGSGTTIIACEQLGRKCRAMEISPAYVAVALQRWADATGKTPALLDS